MNSAISTAIGNINSFDIAVVQALPTQDIDTHTIYLVPKTGETNDVYDEYIYINNAWEMIGNTQIDLSGKADKTDTVLNNTLSMGRKANTTVGSNSVAIGTNVEASGMVSYAEGLNSISNGVASHAQGMKTTSSGQGSHSEGGNTIASGNFSHAQNSGTIASGFAMTAAGIFNVEEIEFPQWVKDTAYNIGDKVKKNGLGFVCIETNNDSTWVSTHWEGYASIGATTEEKTAFVIGNGVGPQNRSNAFRVNFEGEVRTAGNVYVGCNSNSTGGTKVLCEADFATDSDIQNIINGGAGA